MVIQHCGFGRFAVMLVLACGLAGCVSKSDIAYIGLATGDEPGHVRRIIDNSLTEPMAALASKAQSDDYQDRLAYFDAKMFGRDADSPGVTLASIAPFGLADPTFPAGVDDYVAAASTSKKAFLRSWGDFVGGFIQTCAKVCGYVDSREVRNGFAQSDQAEGLFKGYVVGGNESCVYGIINTYKRRLALDALNREFSESTGKRKSLARYLFVEFKSTVAVSGDPGGIVSCTGDVSRYEALYAKYNPQLNGLVTGIVRKALDDAMGNPDF